jgi:uncharacterized membrane protein
VPVRGIGPVHPFMVWNLYLAAIPALLAIALFRRPQRIGVTWMLGLVAWVLFLPNAPYVLTDVVHMVDDLHASTNRTQSYQVLVTYALFFACGLASYVLSLKLFSRFLRRVTQPQVALATLIALHGLCIVAIYLGRFMRFNSWDAVFAPGAVLESVIGVPRPTTVVVLVAMFVVVGVSTCITAAAGSKALAQLRRIFLR